MLGLYLSSNQVNRQVGYLCIHLFVKTYYVKICIVGWEDRWSLLKMLYRKIWSPQNSRHFLVYRIREVIAFISNFQVYLLILSVTTLSLLLAPALWRAAIMKCVPRPERRSSTWLKLAHVQEYIFLQGTSSLLIGFLCIQKARGFE